MHVWATFSDYNALSCHIAINEGDLLYSHAIAETVKTKLRNEFDIHRATIEVKLEDCASHDHHEKHYRKQESSF